jgi:hypothetical protein
MDRATLDLGEKQIHDEAKKRFPGAVERVALLQYGDDPVIEPGELLVRVFIEASGPGKDDLRDSLDAFEKSHRAAIKQFRRDLSEQLPEAGRLEFLTGDETDRGPRLVLGGSPRTALGEGERAGGELTPVMARLGPVDLETLDALITAGIAANRAEAVRWTLARIRERPAYAQLRQRAREIEELKTQF